MRIFDLICFKNNNNNNIILFVRDPIMLPFLCPKASRRLLQKARLVLSPRSPKQLPTTSSKTSYPWQRKEQAALVQFVAIFDDLKKEGSEWPSFGTRHEYWTKAAAFVQETTGTSFRRSGEFSQHKSNQVIFMFIILLLMLKYLEDICLSFVAIEFILCYTCSPE